MKSANAQTPRTPSRANGSTSGESCSVRVFVRFRPVIMQEMLMESENKPPSSPTSTQTPRSARRERSTVQFDPEKPTEAVVKKGGSTNNFVFDQVFGPESTQVDVYDVIAEPVVSDVLEGYNGAILAYGQTGSGKTYTMMGEEMMLSERSAEQGVVPRVASQLFAEIARDMRGSEYTLKASFVEIYNEQIRDLLNPHGNVPVKIREHPSKGVIIENLNEEYITAEEELAELIALGDKVRAVSSTKMNLKSSRSHSVFMLTVTQKLIDGSSVVGTLHLVDLAGSEKMTKSGIEDSKHLAEMKTINLSLTTLGRCIQNLNEGKNFVPYRESKLTFLLKDSLGGNTKTTLLATCSPHDSNAEETISTLRFAQRARAIKNTVKVNKIQSVEDLMQTVSELREELSRLKLRQPGAAETPSSVAGVGGKWHCEEECDAKIKGLEEDNERLADERDLLRRENEELCASQLDQTKLEQEVESQEEELRRLRAQLAQSLRGVPAEEKESAGPSESSEQEEKISQLNVQLDKLLAERKELSRTAFRITELEQKLAAVQSANYALRGKLESKERNERRYEIRAIFSGEDDDVCGNAQYLLEPKELARVVLEEREDSFDGRPQHAKLVKPISGGLKASRENKSKSIELSPQDQVESTKLNVNGLIAKVRQLDEKSQTESQLIALQQVELNHQLDSLSEISRELDENAKFWSQHSMPESLASKQFDASEVRSVIGAIESELSKKKSSEEEVQVVMTTLSEYAARLQKLDSTIGAQGLDDNVALLAVLDSANDELKSVVEGVGTLKADGSFIGMSVETLSSHRTSVEKARQVVKEANAHLHLHRKAKETLLEEIKKLNNQISAVSEEERRRLESELQRVKQDSSETQQQYESDLQRLKSIESEKDRLENELADAKKGSQSISKDLSARIDKLQGELSQSKATKEQLEGLLDTPRRGGRPASDIQAKCTVCQRMISVDQIERHSEACSVTTSRDMLTLPCNKKLRELSNQLRDWLDELSASAKVATPRQSMSGRSSSASDSAFLRTLKQMRGVTESAISVSQQDTEKLRVLHRSLVMQMRGRRMTGAYDDDRLLSIGNNIEARMRDKINIGVTSGGVTR